MTSAPPGGTGRTRSPSSRPGADRVPGPPAAPGDRLSSLRRQPQLLVSGLAAGPVFFAVSLVAGALRAGYSPLRHPISSLELGPVGWVQSANFVVVGVLVVVFASTLGPALRRTGGARSVAVLLALVGVGLVGAGFFDPDPLNGYPPGTPAEPVEPSRHFVWHSLFSTPVFTAFPAACLVLAVRSARTGERSWAVYSAVSGVVMLAFFVLTSVAFAQGSVLTPAAGLLQRLTLLTGFTWLSVLAGRLHRRAG